MSSLYVLCFRIWLHCLSDNVDLEEVERVEQEAAAVLSNVLNVFSGAPKAPKPEAKIVRRSSFKKLTCKGFSVIAAENNGRACEYWVSTETSTSERCVGH